MNKIETELLRKIEAGKIRLTEQGQGECWHENHRAWYEKKPRQNWQGRWTFMFGKNDERTTVYRNRLVWMIANGKPIPDDCFVDHEDHDRTNDSPGNLKLMLKQKSHQQGNDFQTGQNFHLLFRWFTFVEIHGRPPTDEEAEDDSLIFV